MRRAFFLAGLACLCICASAQEAGQVSTIHKAATAKFVTLPNIPDCMTVFKERGDPASGPSVVQVRMTPGCDSQWHWHGVVICRHRLAEHLRSYLRRWHAKERWLLFATKNGTPCNPDLLVKRKLRPLLLRLGIVVPRGNGLHAMRHTNSSVMDRLGAPLKVRQERLGHSSAKLTLDVYTHAASEDGRRLAAQLGEILRPNAVKFQKEGPALAKQALVN